MTYEEAVKLSSIVQWADGGCSVCVSNLMDSIAESWPDIDWRQAFSEGKDRFAGRWEQRGQPETQEPTR